MRPIADGRRSMTSFSICLSIPAGSPRRAPPGRRRGRTASFWWSASAPASSSNCCRPNARVTGIDLSAPMLKVARERVERRGLSHVKSLLAMDAGAMTFEAERFDAALAPYVVSVVPEPRRVLDQMWRVLRPGGELVIVNHFSARTGDARLRSKPGSSGQRAGSAGVPCSPFDRRRLGGRASRRVWREWREVQPLKLFTLLRIGKRA